MKHLIEAILWLVLALLMIYCCIIHAIGQNWFLFVVGATACVLDIINAVNEFSAWARELGQKDAQRQTSEKHKKEPK